MNFSKYYIGILFLSVTALVMARFLILTPETIALMYMDSGLYEDAMKKYEQMLASGNESGNVIIPLAKLYARQGEEKKAIGLLIRYINRNPDLPDAESVLTQIITNATSLEEYGILIEKTPNFSNPNNILTELSSWYESILQGERQIEVLTKMAKKTDHKQTEYAYGKLMSYYSVDMKLDTPSAFVKQFITNENRADRKKSFLSSLTIMVNSEQYQRAMILARRYLDSKNPPAPFEVEKVADIFLNAGQTRLAGEICKQFLNKKGDLTVLQISQYRIDREKGDEFKVMEGIKRDFYSNSIKSKRIYEIAISTALKYGDSKWVKDLLLHADLTKSTQDAAYNYAFYALEKRDAEMAEILKNKLAPETLRISPCLRYIIKSAINRVPVETAASLAGNCAELDKDDVLQLGYVMFHNDYLDEAFLLIKDSPAQSILQFFKIRDLVKVLVNDGNTDGFMDKYEKESLLSSKNQQKIYRDTLFILSAASGLKDRAQKLIAEHPEVPVEVLIDAYSLAEDCGQYDVAVTLAEELCRKNQKDAFRFFLATALVDYGDYARALELLVMLKKKMRAADGLFLRAVAREIEFGGYNRIPSEVRADIEPTLNDILGRKDATVTELKRAAVCLAALGEKEKAEQIYLKLCMDGDSRTTDIDEFVLMCKRSPGEDVRKWFIKQAATGKWEKWMRLSWLNRLGMEKETVDTVERIYKGVELTYLGEYLTALHATGMNEKENEVLGRYKISQLLKLGKRERIGLIGVLSKTGHVEWARQLLSSFSARELVANLSPADIASAFISTNMEKEGLALFGGNGNPKGSALNVMLFLHAFSGNEKFVELWLDSGVVRQENVLINLYYFALKNKRTRLALEIARRLFKSYDNEANMFRLAESLIAEKHFEEGIALINKDAENNNKAGQIYLSGISGLAEAGRFSKESPEAEKFLRICNRLIESPDAPESTVIAVAFALSNTGYHDRAKNLFYNLALAHPDMDESFTKMYLFSTVMAPDRKDFGLISKMVLNTRKEDEQKVLELLETYGMQGHIMLLIEKRHGADIPLDLYRKYLNCLMKCRQMQTFDLIVKKMPPPQSFSLEDMGGIFELLVLAGKEEEASVFYDALNQNKQNTSPSMVRRLGFYFANNKKYEKAISVFFDLVKASNDPDSPDMSLLMSLPEIGTNQDVVNWLVEQAKSSKDEKQLKWLEYLIYIKQPEKVVEILREYYAQ